MKKSSKIGIGVIIGLSLLHFVIWKEQDLTVTSSSSSIDVHSKRGFMEITKAIPTIQTDVRYAKHDNFIGRPITGYKGEKIYLTVEAISALANVQEALLGEGKSLKVFDGYRPQRAVDDFVAWAADLSDQKSKAKYYPLIGKETIIPDGYVAEKSGHTRGSTLDLTIVQLSDGNGANVELDMGTGWDYFGVESHVYYDKLTAQQKENRMLLRDLMLKNGFKPYENEWWHFTLDPEPYPKTYFDFIID